jgi:dihydrofolate synthase/folylpolyglutamate synthase
LLEALEPALDAIVVTTNSSPRALPADELAELAIDVFGDDRVEKVDRLDEALDAGIRLAEADSDLIGAPGGLGVLVTGSVVTVGEARRLLRSGGS